MVHPHDFFYELPQSRIARKPLTHRTDSKLLVVHRETKTISDSSFSSLPSFLSEGDVLVRNNTKVFKARIFGKKPTGGLVEVFLLENTEKNSWECMTKPGLKPGQVVVFTDTLYATCTEYGSLDTTRLLEFSEPLDSVLQYTKAHGSVPLPPYMHHTPTSANEFEDAYQTTYAKETGSVAAPTAGLHFTPELDAKLRKNGIQIAEVTLHVGLGTFAPLSQTQIDQKKLHTERFVLSQKTVDTITAAKKRGNKIVAVGTTTTRVLESCVDESNNLQPQSGTTDLFIYPPSTFRVVDALITNFHLPESSLLMLVTAFAAAPNSSHSFTTFQESIIGTAYQHAVKSNYRFYSFGDAMLLL